MARGALVLDQLARQVEAVHQRPPKIRVLQQTPCKAQLQQLPSNTCDMLSGFGDTLPYDSAHGGLMNAASRYQVW